MPPETDHPTPYSYSAAENESPIDESVSVEEDLFSPTCTSEMVVSGGHVGIV